MRRGSVPIPPASTRPRAAEAPVGWTQVLHRTETAAADALERAGARWQPAWDLHSDVAGVGNVRRLFGVLGTRCHPDLVASIRLALEAPRNRGVLDGATHLAMNRAVAARLAAVLPRLGVHVPWAVDALHLALALQLSEADRRAPLPFRIFYVQAASWLERTPFVHRGGVIPGALVPLPVGGTAQGTWHEPASPLALDGECGLVIEAGVIR